MADWNTKLKPIVLKELENAMSLITEPGLSPNQTEFLRGQIYALRKVIKVAEEKPKPDWESKS